jgi:hydroxyacyl-ACP dehydratase HTD2-like protein with hotdog domain
MIPPGGSRPQAAMPRFHTRPDALQVFSFSAATWNPHRIHYDSDYTVQHEGYDSILVQGPLLGSWLLELAERWVKGWGVVERFTYRTVQPVPVGASLEIAGDVLEVDPRPRASVWVRLDDGTQVAVGEVLAARAEVTGYANAEL